MAILLSLKRNGASATHENAITGFIGVEGGQYYGRAFLVFLQRTRKWTKLLSEGTKCSMQGPRCSLGLLCVGPTAHTKVCSRPSALHEYCDEGYFPCGADLQCVQNRCTLANKIGWLCGDKKPCADGLTCHHGVCYHISEGDVICDGQTRFCKDGLVCTQGFCRKPRLAGEECSLWHPCRTDFLCVDNKCSELGVLESGGQCKRSEQCSGSLTCVGGFCSKNRCGERECGKYEICKNKICVSKKKDMESCNTNSECQSDFCFGYGPGRCTQRRNRGEHCLSNYLLCYESLVCVSERCQDVRFLSEPCVSDLQCKGSLLCGIDGCQRPVKIGDKCDGGRARCGAGSSCHEGKCRLLQDKPGARCSTTELCNESSGLKCVDGKCQRAIEEGQSCSRHVDCKNNLYCAGGRCKVYESIGASCNSKYLCDTKLMCQDNICAMIQMEHGPCNKYMACGTGLYCDVGKRICRKSRNEGDRCSFNSNCAPGLKCVSGKCAVTRRIGESCRKTNQCAADALCMNKRCTQALSSGNYCNQDSDLCARDLVCNKYNRCVPGKSSGEGCDDERTFCGRGYFCSFKEATTSSGIKVEGRCLHKFDVGHQCMTGFMTCKKKLACVDGLCRGKNYLGDEKEENSSGPAQCSFNDPCNKSKKMMARNGSTIRDSCGRLYYVGEKCRLYHSWQLCYLKSSCNGGQVVAAPKETTIRSPCGGLFYVDKYCTLHRR